MYNLLLHFKFVKIVDRKKDLVKLQYGEYVSLGKVESELKTCPLVDNVCVYADPSKLFAVALVMPNPDHLRTISTKSKNAGKYFLNTTFTCNFRVNLYLLIIHNLVLIINNWFHMLTVLNSYSMIIYLFQLKFRWHLLEHLGRNMPKQQDGASFSC